MSRVPYRDPAERPGQGPTDDELVRIARSCGINTREGSLRPPDPVVPWLNAPHPADAASSLSAEGRFEEARERANRERAGNLIVVAAIVGGILVAGLLIVFVVVGIAMHAVPGSVSGATK